MIEIPVVLLILLLAATALGFYGKGRDVGFMRGIERGREIYGSKRIDE
jgi:hypothetical protein